MFWFQTAHPETGEALEVAAVYYPRRRGTCGVYGEPLEPDDVELVRVCEVRCMADGELVDFSAFEEPLERMAWRRAKVL